MTTTFDDFKIRAWENEETIIAALVSSPKTSRLFDVLDEEDFSYHSYRIAYAAAKKLHADGLTVSLLTLSDQLAREGKQNDFKIHDTGYVGLDGLLHIGAAAPRGSELDSVAEQVRDYSANRRLLNLANSIAAGVQGGRTSAEIVEEAEREMGNISAARGRSMSRVRSFREIAVTASERVEEAGKGNVAIPTGLDDLDKRLGGGMYRSDLILVAGRPGNGKSSFLSTIAVNMAEKGKRVGIITLEMESEDYFNRMASQVSGIPVDVLRSGRLSDEQWDAYYAAVAYLAELPIQSDDTPSITPSTLRRKAREMAKNGLDVMLVDYIGLMEGDGKSENRVNEISQISRACKRLAREVKVPVVAAAQLNRAVEARSDPEPFLSDLRDSGSLEQDADVVMFLYRSETNGFSEMKVAKQRNGPTGPVTLAFDKEHTTFKNAFRRTVSFEE